MPTTTTTTSPGSLSPSRSLALAGREGRSSAPTTLVWLPYPPSRSGSRAGCRRGGREGEEPGVRPDPVTSLVRGGGLPSSLSGCCLLPSASLVTSSSLLPLSHSLSFSVCLSFSFPSPPRPFPPLPTPLAPPALFEALTSLSLYPTLPPSSPQFSLSSLSPSLPLPLLFFSPSSLFLSLFGYGVPSPPPSTLPPSPLGSLRLAQGASCRETCEFVAVARRC